MMNDAPLKPSPPEIPRSKLNWLVLLAQLFIPTIATVIVVQFHGVDAAPFMAFFGGIGSGLVAGIMLGLRIGRTTGTRVALSCVFTVVLGAACVGMNCFSCLASGYKLDFR